MIKLQPIRPVAPRRRRLYVAAALPLLAALSAGCSVPQRSGQGKLSFVVEPSTRRGYWLYLPKVLVDGAEPKRAARPLPLVVSFHGMKPFDCAHAQAREWQTEADRYGFIVIAPVLRAPDVLGQFPVRRLDRALERDEETTLAILDHVFETTPADPNYVLSTSWSSGGYMAHYMLNRHPRRFTCLAVRQSNFSAAVLDGQRTPASRGHPVLIVNTQNDFAICRRESKRAVKWYRQNGYRSLSWVTLRALGHERTPDVAADFLARVAGVHPRRSSEVLARRQAIDGQLQGNVFRDPVEPMLRDARAGAVSFRHFSHTGRTGAQ